MINARDPILTITAIRDFFVARNASDLEKSYLSLAMGSPRLAFDNEDWDSVAFAFNRLFVGPGPVTAPPYASVYIDNEPFVMGETTLKVRQLYEMIGLTSPWNETVPDDHIALELDACLHMHQGILQSHAPQLDALYDYFLSEHMSRWVPKFVDKVSQADRTPETILWICRQLSQWLTMATDNVSGRDRNL